MTDIFNPTIATSVRKRIAYAPRPGHVRGLRIGLVENTTTNAEAVLRRVAERLEGVHGMRLQVIVHKQQRAAITDAQIAQLRDQVDFAITGVGA